jgi:hypothetical protein
MLSAVLPDSCALEVHVQATDHDGTPARRPAATGNCGTDNPNSIRTPNKAADSDWA